MKLIKYLSSAAAALISAGILCVSAYADETDVIPEITEAVTEIAVEETTAPDVSETAEMTTVSVNIDTIVSTDITEEPEITEPTPSEEYADGWNLKDDRWFYYIDGVPASGLTEIDGETYLFAPNGALKTGWQTVNSIRTYFDYETHKPVYGWISYMGNTYYNDEQYGKLIGMHEIDGKTYIFKDTGIMQTGFEKCQGYMYYCDENGVLVTGDYNQTPIEINGTWYIISPTGKVHIGWQTVKGLRIFYDYETAEPVYGWINYRGKYYYSDETVGKYTGEQYIDSRPYRFDTSGVIQTGFQSFDDGKACYYYEDGTWATGLITVGKDIYFFDADGFMATGWQTINKNKYYFNADGKMVTGFQSIDGSTYYFGKDGTMATGLTSIGDYKYYFGSDGKMKTGWQTINNHKYYFSDNGRMVTGWLKLSSGEYYFASNGTMCTGFTSIGENTYYFNDDGKKHTGWKTINSTKYYFDSNGVMLTYRHRIDNVDYLFYSNGAMATEGNHTIVLKALSQLGNVGGEPYWTWYGFNYRIEWCACFVSWCAYQCGYVQSGSVPSFISCKVGIDWFKAHNQWKGRSYVPKSGDYIFFDWEPDGVADHIGIVDYYENGYVYTVEGNSNDTCRTKVYSINDSCIYGFAVPNFKK